MAVLRSLAAMTALSATAVAYTTHTSGARRWVSAPRMAASSPQEEAAAPAVSSRREALAASAAFLGAVAAPLAASADEFMMPAGLGNLRYPDGTGVDGKKADDPLPPAPAPAPAAPADEAPAAAPAPAVAEEGAAEPTPAPAAPPAFQIDMSSVKDIPVSTSKLGGLLEPFADVGKGWRILKPYGWNQFDTRPGVYEEKWTDIVAANQQNLLVTTVPVKSTTTRVDALGEVSKVAAKLAAKRQSEVVAASAYTKEGVLFYQFEFKSEAIHQLLVFCVAKGKLWQIDASCPESRWSKTEELFTKSVLSFMPKL